MDDARRGARSSARAAVGPYRPYRRLVLVVACLARDARRRVMMMMMMIMMIDERFRDSSLKKCLKTRTKTKTTGCELQE